MLDLVGAIFGTAYFATQVGMLVGLAALRPGAKLAAFAAAAAWLAVIVGLSASGALLLLTLGAMPPGLLPFVSLLGFFFGCWYFVPQFRLALLSVPLPALIAIHIGRIGGLFFLLLYFDGRLSAPFAPVAAIGDMITGAVALVLAAMCLRGIPVGRGWLGMWNAFGALDLVVAVSLGLLTAPGTPFRVFTDEPGMQAMTMLPWIFVPSLLVPIDLSAHFVIAVRLEWLPRPARPSALAG